MAGEKLARGAVLAQLLRGNLILGSTLLTSQRQAQLSRIRGALCVLARSRQQSLHSHHQPLSELLCSHSTSNPQSD